VNAGHFHLEHTCSSVVTKVVFVLVVTSQVTSSIVTKLFEERSRP